MREVAPYNFQTAYGAVAEVRTGQGAVTDWARILAYVTGTVDQEVLPTTRAELERNTVRGERAAEPTMSHRWL
ncbi:MAG: hypothetical protein EBY18_10685 [Alphaproteobacteria bacterium]|nr:hypothetical protein [Alphaproteobacteria bacterium]